MSSLKGGNEESHTCEKSFSQGLSLPLPLSVVSLNLIRRHFFISGPFAPIHSEKVRQQTCSPYEAREAA